MHFNAPWKGSKVTEEMPPSRSPPFPLLVPSPVQLPQHPVARYYPDTQSLAVAPTLRTIVWLR